MLWFVRGGIARVWRDPEPSERPLRITWRLFAGSFITVGVLMLLRLMTEQARPLDWLLLALLVLTGALAVRQRTVVRQIEVGRRTEAEGFARILRGLSRSVSPDAIVTAIVDELGEVTGADHVIVVQRRPDSRALEATLVSSRPGVRNSTTLLPATDLEAPTNPTADAGGGSDRGTLIAFPIEPDRSPEEPEPVRAGGAPTAVVAGTTGLRLVTRVEPAGGEDRAIDRATAVRIAGRLADRARRAYGLKHTVAEPIVSEGRVVGAIVLSRRVEGEWPESARAILAAAATEASAALDRAHSIRRVETAASTDALTGLPNRRYFDEFCGLLARRRRADDAVGVLMIDIDRFKVLNDGFGHAAGDEVLRAVAGAIASTVREADVPARYGGEEFAVLLRNPSRQVALDVAERVRRAVAGLDVRAFGPASVSVSVGVAVAAKPDEPIADLIERADRALYRAKRAGRDRVIAA
jgi:diguanylate cyclase (GGDEF)-like protein